MKVGWLIDAEMFASYRDDLVKNIRDQGHELKLIGAPVPPLRWDDAGQGYRKTFPEGACVVSHGDIELVLRIGREQLWHPGVFATVERFFCSSYFCHYGRFLLSQSYAMLPFGELQRCKNFLFETFGEDGRVFIRPNSPLKLFTGQTAGADTFDADLEFMAFYEFPPESLVVVSRPQSIETEWRFVVADHLVVAGSQYKTRGKSEVLPSFDDEAKQLADRIASLEYQPDPVWVMDICRTTNGDYHLLEIGGFSFADLYACDKRAVVAAVSESARKVWERRQ